MILARGGDTIHPLDHITRHDSGLCPWAADHDLFDGDRPAFLVERDAKARPARATVAITHRLDRRQIAGIRVEMRQHPIQQRLGYRDLSGTADQW